MVTALTAQGMIIMRLFVVQVLVSTTHGNPQYSVNKQTNNILNHTSLVDPGSSYEVFLGRK